MNAQMLQKLWLNKKKKELYHVENICVFFAKTSFLAQKKEQYSWAEMLINNIAWIFEKINFLYIFVFYIMNKFQ